MTRPDPAAPDAGSIAAPRPPPEIPSGALPEALPVTAPTAPAEAVPNAAVEAAFRFLLGRKPSAVRRPAYATVHDLHHSILASEEFRAGALARKTSLGWPLDQVFVSRAAGVIYCPIGKNACSYLKSLMLHLSDHPHAAVIAQNVHLLTDYVRTGLQLSDYEEGEVAAMIADPGILKVAVLRDSRDRLLSAYTEKLMLNRLAVGNIHHARSVVRPAQARRGVAAPDFDRGITFRDFVEQVTRDPRATLDPHWRPQHLYLQGIAYDRLYRFDAIDALVDDLEARAGRALPRQPRNVTGSGRGPLRPGAMDLLPAELAAGPRLDRESYFDEGLDRAIAAFFAADEALLTQARGRTSSPEAASDEGSIAP